MKLWRALAATVGMLATLVVTDIASAAIDEFQLAAGAQPGGITAGPDGALWFTDEGTQSIGRITTAGVVTNTYPLTLGTTPDQITTGPVEPNGQRRLWFTEYGTSSVGALNPATGGIEHFPTGSQPSGITAGPDNASLWFTEFGPNRISQIRASDGAITAQIPIPNPPSEPSDITVGPDGQLWFTEQARNKVSSVIASSGSVPTQYPLPTLGSQPSGIISSGSYLWFTEAGTNQIGRITTTGSLQEFGPTGADPSGIAAGRDGALWFTLSGANAIGRITSGISPTITNQSPTPTPGSTPSDITVGPDGALWFTEFTAGKIGRIETAPPAPPPPPPPPPVVALSFSSLKMSPSSFRAAPKGASITAKKKTGTTVSYNLTIAATTRFTVEQPQRGQKRGKKCVKPKRGKKGKRCTRYVVLKGSFRHTGKPASNKFRFSGRVGGKKLRPGKYRLVAVASTGASKAKAKRANFKIVR